MKGEKPTIFWLSEYAVDIFFQSHFHPHLTAKLLQAKDWIEKSGLPGLKEVTISYQSLTVFYDPVVVRTKLKKTETSFDFVKEKLNNIPWNSFNRKLSNVQELKVPVKYGSLDLEMLSEKLSISTKEIIDLHTSTTYTVYSIGFLPGFPYLGSLPQELRVERKSTPSLQVKKGSVAIAGEQTGIYPQNSPGGWHILGKTEMEMYDFSEKSISPFKVGDQVRFYSI